MFAVIPLLLLAFALLVIGGAFGIAWTAMFPPSKGLGWCLGRGEPTGPEDFDTTGQERTLHLSRGDTTQAWDLVGHDPQGPCVLYAHGHAGSRFQALSLAGTLLPFASRVITFDLPGHGDASARRCTVGVREPDDFAALITQIHDELQTDTPADEPAPALVLFGTSMSAQSALAAAAQPDVAPRLDGLVVYGIYRHFREPFVGHLRRHRLPAFLFAPLALGFLRLFLGPGVGFDRAAAADRLRCTALFLHGDHDDLCPLASARYLRDRAAAAGVDAQLAVFPGGGHTRLHQTHPEPYTQTISGFLHRFRTPRADGPPSKPHLANPTSP